VRNLVVSSNGGVHTDRCVRIAAQLASDAGAVVLISVLPGSLIAKGLSPDEAGRRRRAAEDEATAALAAQLERVAPGVEASAIALFGDVVFDTLLLAGNLGADAVAMTSDDPALGDMIARSPIPVVAVPRAGSS
jgi:hypothetical protein